jgi:hypothetical protein
VADGGERLLVRVVVGFSELGTVAGLELDAHGFSLLKFDFGRCSAEVAVDTLLVGAEVVVHLTSLTPFGVQYSRCEVLGLQVNG